MANVIDTLLVELGIADTKFNEQAAKAETTVGKLEKSFGKTEAATKKHTAEQKKATAELATFGKAVEGAIKGIGALMGAIMGASGLSKLAVDAAKANQELESLSANLGMSSKGLAEWKGAADMAGGSAEGMAGYMQSLQSGMMGLVMMGDTSMLPYFNALGVSMLDSSGKTRKLNDVMLDLADSMQGMDRTQAYHLGKQMGMDDGTINTLIRGRAEVQRMLDMQSKLYRSSKQDEENSRIFNEKRAYLNQQWESFLLLLGNTMIPIVATLTEKVSAFMEYLIKHERAVKAVFLGLSTAIGLALIPVLLTATAAVWAFIAPFIPLAAAVIAVGAAFALLYDDYQTWADGGNSLFDWGRFIDYIKTTDLSVNNLAKAFTFLITGYTKWSDAANSLLDWLRLKGFIDGNTVSVESLKNGFHSLYTELKDFLLPYMYDLFDAMNAIKNGDFSGAFDALKSGGGRALDGIKETLGAVGGRVAGAVDVATGHEVGTLGGKASSGGKFIVNGAATGKYKASNKNKHNQQIIAEEARKAGIDPSIMLAMAHIETGGSFNEKAKNPKSSASGLFQFMAYTRGRYGMDAKTVFDARANSRGAAKMLNENRSALRKVLGREPTAGELYLAHQQGLGGARQLLSNPNGSALEAVARAHKGNYGIARQIIKLNGGNLNMTSGQFASLWINKGNALQNAYRGNFVENIQSAQTKISNANNFASANGKTVHNNNRTEVVVQNVNVHTSANNMNGTGKDMANGIGNRLNQINVGMM